MVSGRRRNDSAVGVGGEGGRREFGREEKRCSAQAIARRRRGHATTSTLAVCMATLAGIPAIVSGEARSTPPLQEIGDQAPEAALATPPGGPLQICYVREILPYTTCCALVNITERIPCGPSKFCDLVRAGRDDGLFKIVTGSPGWSEDKFGESQPSAECAFFAPRCVQDSTGYNCALIPIPRRSGCWSWGEPSGPPNCG
jgi:hypothetical protein